VTKELSLSTLWRHTGEAEVQLHLFLTSALDGGEWSAYYPTDLPSGRNLVTYYFIMTLDYKAQSVNSWKENSLFVLWIVSKPSHRPCVQCCSGWYVYGVCIIRRSPARCLYAHVRSVILWNSCSYWCAWKCKYFFLITEFNFLEDQFHQRCSDISIDNKTRHPSLR
jgi:hypothetical protein